MSGEAEATIDPKDITYDILIDDTERPDRGGSEAAGGPVEPKGDHPVVAVLDMAMKHSGGYLQKQNLPPPNTDIYKDFSKPFLNEACWYYLPDGTLPDDPRLALALGVGGLALAFAPTLLAVYERKEQEQKKELEEKKRRKQRREEETEEREEEQRKPDVPPGPVAEPPDWMTRLESGMLGGM